MTPPAGPRVGRSLVASALALSLTACGSADDGAPGEASSDTPATATQPATATAAAEAPPAAASTASAPDGPTIVVDGPVMTLDPAVIEELTANGEQIIASAGSPRDRVVIVLARDVGEGGISVRLTAVPDADADRDPDALDGAAGDLLPVDDSCTVVSSELGWTAVVTDDPAASVSVPLADGTTAVEPVQPAVVGEREVGVVLLEGTVDPAAERPSADPGGDC